MLFNSLDFALFLPIVFAVYWTAKTQPQRNLILLVASGVFYSWWDIRFLILIVLSICIDFWSARRIAAHSTVRLRQRWLLVSLAANLGTLAIFKYYGFFVDSFVDGFRLLGVQLQPTTLEIILPVGISFYTFQTLSYTIDVYRGHLRPVRDFLQFATFVSFFPQLVAGPIERAQRLLPQFADIQSFNSMCATVGLRLILWGVFKKMVIADNCGIYVDQIFAEPTAYNSTTLILGAVLFAFQIYGDFSGYSDIAIGTGRLFGIRLMTNFATPYFARDLGEFWRRWHISLSTWFRDYVYIPLGGSRHGKWCTARNVMVVFLTSGLWHGANWTFVVWGGLHGLFFLPAVWSARHRRYVKTEVAGYKALPRILLTFSLVTFCWIFFRSDNLTAALFYLQEMADWTTLGLPFAFKKLPVTLLLIGFMLGLEWLTRHDAYPLERLLATTSRWKRWSFYAFLVFLIGAYAQTAHTPFIYFQF